jgi:hypothetical protein
MFTAVVVVVLVVLAGLAYQYFKRTPEQVAAGGSGVSAFARLAEADGKIIALKAGTELKLAEAKLRQTALDEVHKILG